MKFAAVEALLATASSFAIVAAAGAAQAQAIQFNLPAQPASTAVPEFGRQAGVQILAAASAVQGQTTTSVQGRYEVGDALKRMLQSTDLRASSDQHGLITLVPGRQEQKRPVAIRTASAAPTPVRVAQPVAAAAPEAASAPPGLEEIVVTARREAETITRSPVAIEAVSAAKLESKSIIDLQTLSAFTPGFRKVQQNGGRNDRGYNTMVMRGIFGGDGIPRQPVRIFVDGTPIVTGDVAGFDGVDRVEVIRGPQSAYFGRATFAGAINYITRTPGDAFKASASAEYGSFDRRELRASVEGPIVKDVVAGRISVRDYAMDGQYKNYFCTLQGTECRLGSQKTQSVTGSLSFTPGERLRIKAFVEAWRDKDGPSANGLYPNTLYNCNPAGGAVKNYVCGPIKAVPASTLYAQVGQPPAVFTALTDRAIALTLPTNFVDFVGLKRKSYTALASFDYDIPGGYLLSGNYSHSLDRYGINTDVQNMPAPAPRIVYVPVKATADTAELRVTSPLYFERLKLMVGANYLSQAIPQSAPAYLGNVAAISYATQPLLNANKTAAVFGSLHWAATDKLSVDLEGRYQDDKVTQQINPNYPYSPASTLRVSKTQHFKSFTPKAIVSYQIDDAVMAYASYAVGTRPGEFNTGIYALGPVASAALIAQTGATPVVDPERLRMYEAGLKGTFFERRLRVLAAAYYGSWTSRHVAAQVLYTPPGTTTSQFVRAITGSSEVDLYGVEFSSDLVLNQNLSLSGTFAFNESDIQLSSCVTCQALTGNANQVGNRLPLYPAYTASLSLNYTRPISENLTFYGSVDYIYTGKQYESEADLAWTPASNQFNARIGLGSGRYRVDAIGMNLTDNKTPIGVATNPNYVNGGNTIVASPPLRRYFGVKVSYAY